MGIGKRAYITMDHNFSYWTNILPFDRQITVLG